MVLDENKPDRSYQFGRLLAVMEAVERATYGREEDREPNAIRLQSVFNERPLHTAKVIDGQLNPYFDGQSVCLTSGHSQNRVGYR